jgi:hypothetical protein
VGTAAVVAGLGFALWQVGEWRRSARVLRRAEAAEEVLAAAQSCADVIRTARSRLTSIPLEEAGKEWASGKQKYRYTVENFAPFERLHLAEQRYDFRSGSELIRDDCKSIHDIRFELILDFEELLAYPADRKERRPEDEATVIELTRRIFGRLNDADTVESQLKAALAGLAKTLGPDAKLEA